MEKELVRSNLCDVTDRLWTQNLGFLAEPTSEVPASAQALQCRGATVSITGAWCGDLYLQTSEELAERLAQRMFDLGPAGAPDEEQIADCLKEVTNITAGYLKASLPEPSKLSIPEPFTHPSWRIEERAAQRFLSLVFRCAGQPLRLTLQKRG